MCAYCFYGFSTRFKVTFFNFLIYLQNLTKTLLVDKRMPSLRLALNTSSCLFSQQVLLRVLAPGPLTGDVVTSFHFSTMLAWGNTDRLKETLSGGGTSHRINGIAVQPRVFGPLLPLHSEPVIAW